MKEQEIKRSIDFISVDKDKKDEIFNNIVNKKVKSTKTPKIYYLKFATTMAAAFVLLFGAYHVTSLLNFGSDGSTMDMATAGGEGNDNAVAEEAETDDAATVTEEAVPEADYDNTEEADAGTPYVNQRADLIFVNAFRAYSPNSDEVYVIENAGEDMSEIWQELINNGVYPSHIVLNSVDKTEDTLKLYFSEELQYITNENGNTNLADAISKSFMEYNFDMTNIEIYCAENILTHNGENYKYSFN